MTTARQPHTRWRQATAIVLFVGVGALSVTATAHAEPVKQIDAYNSCYKQAKLHEGSTAASFDCCVVAGGRWTGGTYPDGHCTLKNAPVPDPSAGGATAILHPGVDTRAGTQ